MDAPAHMEQRSMVEPVFVEDHVETMKPYIQKTVDDLLDQMIKKGCEEPVDLVASFALPVPSYVSLIKKKNVKPGYRALDCADSVFWQRSFTPSLASRLRTSSTSRSRTRSDRMAAGPPCRRRRRASPLSPCLPVD